ncbi:hypothetical protein Pla108_15580 [Botrimarina colliarenosi]|uniref:Heat induced stress protein YflT n=1 Tax=Botrimarina colliarenosi TaxID=2528001 RepID=A0A5C6ANC1_9BACT|nr:hypothetical protein [Botrimarina colliarenosi]TWU00606.1 hypothetical protein Pla108_15580 [Botrimarina colliarenosi]
MSTTHDKAVFCITDDRSKALSILSDLRASGFTASEISVVMAHEDSDGEIAIEGHTKAPEGAATGAGSGMVLGGALGWMAGIGALAIPGLGPFIAAGPIMAALGGAAIGGAAGTLTGGLIGLGFSEYEAKQYESYLKDGNALISVSVCDGDEVSKAKKIFSDADAKHISTQGAKSDD